MTEILWSIPCPKSHWKFYLWYLGPSVLPGDTQTPLQSTELKQSLIGVSTTRLAFLFGLHSRHWRHTCWRECLLKGIWYKQPRQNLWGNQCREMKWLLGVTQQERAQIHPSLSYISSSRPHLSGFQKDVSHTVSMGRTKTLDYFSFGPRRFQYHMFSLLDHPLIALRLSCLQEIFVNVEDERWLSQIKLRIITKKKMGRGATPRIHRPTHHPVFHSVIWAVLTFNYTTRMLSRVQ